MPLDDWEQFAMELWGITITTWAPDPERDGKLPEPLEYDVLQDGLVELESEQRKHVLQSLSCYQVIKLRSSCFSCELIMTIDTTAGRETISTRACRNDSKVASEK